MAMDSLSVLAPQPAPTEGEAVWPSIFENEALGLPAWLVADMKARHEAGVAKYGVPLRVWNGRDAAIDALRSRTGVRSAGRAPCATGRRARHWRRRSSSPRSCCTSRSRCVAASVGCLNSGRLASARYGLSFTFLQAVALSEVTTRHTWQVLEIALLDARHDARI